MIPLLLLALGCAASDRAPAGPPGLLDGATLDPPESGLQLSVGPVEYAPYTEQYLCALMPVGNDRTLNIVALEHQGSPITHHFNAYLIGEPVDGVIQGDCEDVWDEVSMGLSSPVYASQTLSFRGDFPEGVAGQVPTGQSVLLEYHGLNPFPEPRVAEALLNIHTAERSEIDHFANGLYGSNANINLAPGERKILSKDCYVDVDMNLFVFGSHAHQMLEYFEIYTLDTLGHLGERVYFSDDWQTPLLDIREEPVFVPRGGGLQFRCAYHNVSDNTVRYGDTSTDEMCMMAGVYWPDDGFKFCRSSPPRDD
ncbi:MAG: hypothetical protein H6740_07035 [Alphaproteobacteria bacterium]|nr:hypothetical protein [Alphaproteobacteria bacterium]